MIATSTMDPCGVIDPKVVKRRQYNLTTKTTILLDQTKNEKSFVSKLKVVNVITQIRQTRRIRPVVSLLKIKNP